ncbi:MAG TPA: PEGA domain-containing protein, partial [Planctomycetaceae bacterium]|nr:PEGA domain-containing protein [Planctomycetaceae bacterium]
MPASTFPKNLSRTVCLTLAAVLAVAQGSGFVVSVVSADTGVSALSVSTDPDGAAVYLDGKLAGHTPLTMPAVPVGDHRVRVVKDGYLENSRVVGVREGQPNTVAIKLTRDAGGPGAPPLAVAPGDPSSKKWLWIGLGAVAVGGGAYLLLPKNAAPTVSSVTASPS